MGIDKHRNLWWGYIHVDGSLHAKRYFDKQDIIEARNSPFVNVIFEQLLGTRESTITRMKNWKEINA